MDGEKEHPQTEEEGLAKADIKQCNSGKMESRNYDLTEVKKGKIWLLKHYVLVILVHYNYFAELAEAELETTNSGINLPEEMLRVIYRYVLEPKYYFYPQHPYDKHGDGDYSYYVYDSKESTETLLNCRLVCSTWRNAVDGYTDFMDQLCCTVYNLPEFLNSTICGKVKTLRFVEGLSAEQDQLDIFYNQIVPDVKKFIFEFDRGYGYSGYWDLTHRDISGDELQKLFSNLIWSAKNLEEITIGGYNKKFLMGLDTIDEVEQVGTKVKTFYLNFAHLVESEIRVLKKLVFGMSNLSKLNLSNTNSDRTKLFVNKVIIPHIEMFPGSLKVS